jgi:methionyl-tRNA formyltransferase
VKIGYLADGPWAHEALERLLADDRITVEFIVPRFTSQDPVLREMAADEEIDFLLLQNVNDANSLRLLDSYGVDLLVSMSFDQIFWSDIISLPPKGIINCHAGALPFYRGRNILNWALINDEKEFGVTVHQVDEGIDTGDIIVQRMSEIRDEDTYASLLDRAITICADALCDAISQIADGIAEPTDQSTIHPVGFYTGRRIEGDEWIDWNWSSRRVFNFVRAITTPGPCARTCVDGYEIRVVRAELLPEAPSYIATVGEVVGMNAGVVHVKTGDSVIALTKVEADGDVKLRIGKRLQSLAKRREQLLERRLDQLEREVAELSAARS